MNDCIFCKIVNGEIPSYKVYEDEEVIAFLDIAPNNPGHTLVVPKEHSENMYSITDEALCKLILRVKQLTIAVKNGMDADGINVTQNNETAAGQIVPHIHFHIIPRFTEDGYKHWPQKKYKEGEAEEVLEKIKAALNF